jgi:hypothetical protein
MRPHTPEIGDKVRNPVGGSGRITEVFNASEFRIAWDEGGWDVGDMLHYHYTTLSREWTLTPTRHLSIVRDRRVYR